ncbi:hypothetical protein [Actinacidiphila acididurans]|uniref:Uncharacterized protein n=1 Tax=Actinacidiphila acididurans TaxID=2784346 RepID=A0ABS2TTR1_9ACTN|nr:hypothetical protein [Actinacidiphila acididurans]MBM9506725.1 hypothetical protein [Actinacidiphila acididurans]
MPRHTLINHRAAAAAAKDNPGVFVETYPSREVVRNTALRIPPGERAPACLPAAAYEAYAAQHKDGDTVVRARYVHGMPELEPRPHTRTYQVCDRGSGREYEGARITRKGHVRGQRR